MLKDIDTLIERGCSVVMMHNGKIKIESPEGSDNEFMLYGDPKVEIPRALDLTRPENS